MMKIRNLETLYLTTKWSVASMALALVLSNSLWANESRITPITNLESVTPGLVYNPVQPGVENETLFAGKNVAFLVSHGVQESELTFPLDYLIARGANVEILAPDWIEDKVTLVKFLRPTNFLNVDKSFSEALQGKQYDLIVLAGGAWNVQVVRKDEKALKLIKEHCGAGLPIAAVCAGSQILITAGLANERNLTGTSSVRLDLENAGAIYVDQPVVRDGQLLTGRGPDDLEEFVEGLGSLLTE